MSEQIRELGKRLVLELQLKDSFDTLGRWMAHYVAEVMQTAETATGPQAAKAKMACFQTILALWEHLHQAPGSDTKFLNYDRAAETLNFLHPNGSEQDWHHYFQERDRAKSSPTKTEKQVRQLQDRILDLDWGTRLLMEHLVGELSRATTPPDANDKVLDLLPDCSKSEVFRTLYLVGSRGMFHVSGMTQPEQKRLRIRILRRLAAFAISLERSLTESLKGETATALPTARRQVKARATVRTRRRKPRSL